MAKLGSNNADNLGADGIKESVGGQKWLHKRLTDLYYNIIKDVKGSKSRFPLNNMPENKASRDNLLSYLALRQHNLEDLQLKLAEEGLSSLGRLEGHVLIGIEQVLKHLKKVPIISPESSFHTIDKFEGGLKRISYKDSRTIIDKRSRLLLGRPRKGRSTRIMVTLDSVSTHQPHLLEELLRNGMDITRINCAHDTPKEWKMLIDSIRHAEERLIQRDQGVGRRCRIVMDMAGPKIRTGSMGVRVRPLKITVPKDLYGRPLKLVEGFFDGEAKFTEKVYLTGVQPSFVISIKRGAVHLASLNIGEKLWFRDARGRYRTVTILERISPSRVKIGLDKNTVFQEGTIIHKERIKEISNMVPGFKGRNNIEENNSESTNYSTGPNHDSMNFDSTKIDDNERGEDTLFIIGPVRPQPIAVEVKTGDIVLLLRNKSTESNMPSIYFAIKKPIAGKLSCTIPEVLKNVEVGHRVYVDDGKINAVVRSSTSEYLELEILSTPGSTKIKAEKGLNFPDSDLQLPALTAEDIKNLGIVVRNATAVGLSFVHSADDIRNLHKSLGDMGQLDFGVIAKIETRDAVHNLANILLAGLDLPNFGVLIARGDLAVEVGFENLPIIQEDILCLCEAAHVPVILATQVLEMLAKSGLPTRAEMTDAALGQRAECVMLNKGKHILEAVKILSMILKSEEKHHAKKRQIFSEFTKQLGFP